MSDIFLDRTHSNLVRPFCFSNPAVTEYIKSYMVTGERWHACIHPSWAENRREELTSKFIPSLNVTELHLLLLFCTRGIRLEKSTVTWENQTPSLAMTARRCSEITLVPGVNSRDLSVYINRDEWAAEHLVKLPQSDVYWEITSVICCSLSEDQCVTRELRITYRKAGSDIIVITWVGRQTNMSPHYPWLHLHHEAGILLF